VFGINGNLNNNLFLIEDHRLVYSAGNNVIVYSTEDKSQHVYQGNEESHGITAVAISTYKKFIAICERDNVRGAQCSIFDLQT